MRQYFLPVVTGLMILLLWQMTVLWFHVEKWILPGPLEIISSFWQTKELMFYHIIPTVFEAIVGLISAIFIGIAVALIMEWSPLARKIIYPFLILSQTIPFIALAPLLTLWFGFGLIPKVIVIALVCFFPITISLFDGFSTIDSSLLKLMHSMNATRWQMMKWVKWPSSLPTFFSGLRIAGAYSILAAVISEWVGADRGLGIFLTRSAKSYLVERVFAIVGIITVLSIAVVLTVEGLARIFIPWHYYKKMLVRNKEER